MEIRPQRGPQEAMLASNADFVIFGGAAGGGKTWSLLLEPLRHANNPKFGCVMFRRTFAQIDQEGGLWEKSMELYPLAGATPNLSKHMWTFPSRARVRFAHLADPKSVFNYQGGEVALMMFDEITHFDQREIFYLITRNRSTSGVRPYIRATCNPDPDSWVAKFISWWIGSDGYALPERSGIVRWFARDADEIHWADTKTELLEQHPHLDPEQPLSFTFIVSRLKDNPALLEQDPTYRAKLLNQDRVTRERLLGDEEKGGNWHIRAAAGTFFRRTWFEIIDEIPHTIRQVRAWDFAATKPTPDQPDPDYTVGLKVGLTTDGFDIILDLVKTRDTPGAVDELFVGTNLADPRSVLIHIPQDPGEAGKTVAQQRATNPKLGGRKTRVIRPTGDKVARASLASNRAEHRKIKVVRAGWNDFFFGQLEAFPDGRRDDVIDTLADAVNELHPAEEGKPRAAVALAMLGANSRS